MLPLFCLTYLDHLTYDIGNDMNQSIRQKSREISYAALRLAAYVRRFELRRRLEALAYHLLENVSYKNTELTLGTIEAIDSLVALGKSVYEIEPVNAKIIARELELLAAEIQKVEMVLPSGSIESIFSAKPFEKAPARELMAIRQSASIIRQSAPAIPAIAEKTVAQARPSEMGQSAVNRQSAILEIIQKSAERRLQLKDIIASLPGVSERTIRYDLKYLCETGKLTRQGNGGPSNFYALS